MDACIEFYSKLGLVFAKEKHGNGPIHFASVLNGLVFEIYPCKEQEDESNVRLGFNLDIKDKNYSNVKAWVQQRANSSYTNESGVNVYILSDPGLRKVEVGFE